MSFIEIKNLKIYACHGVLEEEKTNPQPCCFDVRMEYDFCKAAQSDNLNLTLNYDEVMHDVSDFCQSNRFDLIETLCARTATMLMRKYPIQSIKVSVSKPDAPVSLCFDTVKVTTQLTRRIVLLSLGSSMGDRQTYLDMAINELKCHADITLQKVSAPFENPPYGGVAKATFINMAAQISTYLSPKELLDAIHQIEDKANRIRDVRWGDRTLDIDIVFFGDIVSNDEALTLPHPDFQNREFVLSPLVEIAPNFRCPLSKKTVKELYDDWKSNN